MYEVVDKYVFPFIQARAANTTHGRHMRDARLTIAKPALLQKAPGSGCAREALVSATPRVPSEGFFARNHRRSGPVIGVSGGERCQGSVLSRPHRGVTCAADRSCGLGGVTAVGYRWRRSTGETDGQAWVLCRDGAPESGGGTQA